MGLYRSGPLQNISPKPDLLHISIYMSVRSAVETCSEGCLHINIYIIYNIIAVLYDAHYRRLYISL